LAIAPQLCRCVPPFPRAFKAAIGLQVLVCLGILGALAGFAYWLMGAQSLWPVGMLIVVAATAGSYMVTRLWQSHRLGGISTAVFAMSVVTMTIAMVAWVVEPSPIKAIHPMVETASRWAKDSRTIPVYYTDLHSRQKRNSLPVYLSRHFHSHQELTPDSAVERYLSPAPALFIIGARSERFFNALELRHEAIPPHRLLRIEWIAVSPRLRSHPFWRAHPFWLLRNFD
jgi:hypothetical protein